MSDRKIVCLDPGHGPDTVNGSPDGSYKEREFTWDLYLRLRVLLEEQGIAVVGTRGEDEKPGLTDRAEVSNKAGADLFVSLHTNAAGNDGWYDPKGLMIYTSSGPITAPRNQAALDILAQARAAGIEIWGSGLAYEGYTVLTKTAAPAVLIEFGFHTNREEAELLKSEAYRDRLALAVAKGVCDFLGVTWQDTEEREDTPAPWAAEAWEKAVRAGVLDGTRPWAPLTRQELAVVLDRLGLLS
ncbi:N-acetylmuramoyl-L-alanine amidase family protein [Lawsonibacter celer]|jgi:N-acetylmuramoyl-L-alanine amidase|uniref:N-acetylmuramoyl-L-alanine amidase family protein n=1 Tax=Lawsonibacter celer TaxID=2986526 RepID=UPI00164918F5|nr:N-acetylmuramoyl-L-alanine amidase [Lawsonibacter celer]